MRVHSFYLFIFGFVDFSYIKSRRLSILSSTLIKQRCKIEILLKCKIIFDFFYFKLGKNCEENG